MRKRVLIIEDDPPKYKRLRKYLEEEGFEVAGQVISLGEAQDALRNAERVEAWFHVVMIDVDLSNTQPGLRGTTVYEDLARDFPDETYLIYTSQDTETVRDDVNRMQYRDVQVLLLSPVLTEKNIRFHLKAAIPEANPRTAFLVHGRNTKKARDLRRILENGFGLEVIQFGDVSSAGSGGAEYIWERVLRGIQRTHVTIVLFTDDEYVELKRKWRKSDDPESQGLKRSQARANVYIEAGFAMGVRPRRTVFVEWPVKNKKINFMAPSNFGGIDSCRFDGSEASIGDLRRRLRRARCEVL